ncbi:MAG: GAF domain-containing protein [Burkholderiaceae bacterium]
MTVTLDAIRDCLEGATPAVMATCDLDGVPNVAYLSQVHYIDPSHVALSFQFFNKTRENVLANPQATLLVIDPNTGATYRIAVRYLRTETEGPLFEHMKARLAGIASHTGMAGVFRLRGSDVYRVLEIERIPGATLPAAPRRNRLAALRTCARRLAACTDLAGLFNETLECLAQAFDVRHAMLLMFDRAGGRLYTVASLGYERSGVGSEIALGAGVIGVAAREGTPIRISHMTSDYAYARAIRHGVAQQGLAGMLETEIPLPGLAQPHSQLAVPVADGQQLYGVLCVESGEDLRFTYDDEDALVTLAAQLAVAIRPLQAAADADDEPAADESARAPAAGAPVVVRHYAADGSTFVDNDYLIKGVAGSILWALVQDHVASGRVGFTNRELRLDPRIRLPDVTDNLEARLVLLQRRLVERESCVRIEKTGRGRFRLCVSRPLVLEAAR